jgi:DNA-directed RNA polymerase specialized sigma24 family protein
LFSIAYPMTGSVAEAEDLVQEAFSPPLRVRHDQDNQF